MLEQENKPQTVRSGRFFKFALVVCLILGVILIGIVSIKLDSLREPIMDELSQMTGFSIEIESLNLSLSNGLSLRGGGLKVNSNDDPQQIFSAENLFLDAELAPLLKRQLKIKKITLVKPTMSVVLEPKLESDALPDNPRIGKIRDQETAIRSGEMESSELPKAPFSEPSLIGSIRKLLQRQDLSLRKFEMKGATLIFVRPESNLLLPTKRIPILMDARFDLSNPNPNQIDIDGELSHIEIGGLNLTGTLKVTDLLGKHISLNVALGSTSLPVTKINTLTETLAGPEAIPVKFESGEIEKMFIHLEGLINLNQNPFKEVVIKSGFKISNLEISMPEIKKPVSITLSHLDGEGAWQKDTLNYKINGNLWDGSIQSNLAVNLPNALKGSLIGTFNSETRLEKSNLALLKFNLSDTWTPITGIASGFIKTQGSIGEPLSNLYKYGELNINDLSLGSDTPTTVKQASLNIQKKSSQQALARFQIKEALLNNVSIQTAGVNLKIFPEKVLLTNGRVVPPNGAILFSGDYRPRSNTYTIRIKGNKLRVEDFLADQVQGSGFFKGMLQGNLNAAQKIKQQGEVVLFSHVASSLSGKLSIQLKNGGIRSLPVIDELLPHLASTSGVIEQYKGLNYEKLSGDLKIWNGKAVTDNLELKGPQMNLAAMAAANLVTGKLEGEIKVMPIQLFESIKKAVPLLGNLLNGNVTNTLSETYFKLGGTLGSPQLVLEEGKTLFGKPSSILEDLVKTPR